MFSHLLHFNDKFYSSSHFFEFPSGIKYKTCQFRSKLCCWSFRLSTFQGYFVPISEIFWLKIFWKSKIAKMRKGLEVRRKPFCLKMTTQSREIDKSAGPFTQKWNPFLIILQGKISFISTNDPTNTNLICRKRDILLSIIKLKSLIK